MATRCKFRGRRGILCDVLKIDGSLARNIDFEVANFQVLRKTRRKTSILKLQSVKIGGSLARNPCFGAPTCLVWSLWFSCGFAVSMGEAAKPLLVACFRPCENLRKSRAKCWSRLESLVFLWLRRVYRGSCKTSPFGGFQAGCHVVLRGRRGTLWHSNLFDNVSKVSKLEEVSHEMLVLLRPRVSSRVSGFSCGLAVSMGEAAKHLLIEGLQAGCHVVWRGRRGTL